MNNFNFIQYLIQRWNLLNHEFCKAPENLEKEISSTPARTLHDVNRKLGFLQCDLHSKDEAPDFFQHCLETLIADIHNSDDCVNRSLQMFA